MWWNYPLYEIGWALAIRFVMHGTLAVVGGFLLWLILVHSRRTEGYRLHKVVFTCFCVLFLPTLITFVVQCNEIIGLP